MLTIREAELADIAAIHALGSSVPEFEVSGETVNFWPPEILAEAVHSEDVVILVALQPKLVGFVIVNLNKGLKKAIVENVYVHPDSRGSDIGISWSVAPSRCCGSWVVPMSSLWFR